MELCYFLLGMFILFVLSKIFGGIDTCDCYDDDDTNDRPMRKIRMTSSIYFDDDEEFLIGEEAFVRDDSEDGDYITAYKEVDDWDSYVIPLNSFVYVD